MSEVKDAVNGTVESLLNRLAEKLGTTVDAIWKFSVMAKAVEAKRDVLKGLGLLFVVLVLWTASACVALMKMSHETYVETQSPVAICDFASCKYVQPPPTEKDRGLADRAYLYIAIAAALAGIGLVTACAAGNTIIDALASAKTTEADALSDLLYDLRG
jgi:hypothetical protein